MRAWPAVTAAVVLTVQSLSASPARPSNVSPAEKQLKRPALSLRATPNVAFSPATVHFYADLRGGPDDFQAFYCPTVEWDWGDGTTSDTTADCDPYVSGKTAITRHYSEDRLFRGAGQFLVTLRLKHGDKVLTEAGTTVVLRGGWF